MSNALTPPYVDPCACPLCGKPNQCAMATISAKGQAAEPCWCVTVTFTPELLARVPEHAQRQACICKTCATSHPSL